MNSSVCLLTSYTPNYSPLAALTIPHMKEYARRHGFEFRVLQNADLKRRGGWIKIDPIRATLEAGFDFVFWVDIDALIVRNDVDIRNAVKPGADLHVAWHAEGPVSEGIPAHFNTGIMLIRSTDWARNFFARVWDNPVKHYWTDQAAIHHLLGYDDILGLGTARPDEPDRKRIAVLDNVWNSIVGIEVADDPIIHHYAGIHNEKVRISLMELDEATIDQRLKETPQYRREFLKQLGEWRRDSVRVILHRTNT